MIENRIESNLKQISKTLLVDIQSDSTFTLDQFVTMQEKVTKRKTLMMDAKNLEVERAVEDLINIVLSFPMEDFGSASISDETVQKLRDHYSRLMYLAILNTTKNSFHTLKKRLTSRTSTGGATFTDKPFFDVNVELSLPNVTMNPSLEEIQATYGHDEVHVRVQGGSAVLAGMPGVLAVTDHGNVQQVRLSIDPQAFLAQLVARTTVQRFEITRPSLHDIFVEIARPTPEEDTSPAA